MFSPDDHRHMARALELARRGLYTTDPNPRVGCVLVRDDQVVGEGWHERAGEAHAEVMALAASDGQAQSATAYVTLEPCDHTGRTAPCSQALIDAGVSRVVAASVDPFPAVAGQGLERLRAAGIEVDVGLMQEEAEALNPGFLSRHRHGRPWVRVKLAASLDGRTAMASGESQWITSEEARLDVQHWRARASAILTGSGTVLADDPRLNVRLEVGRQPVRVVLDSRFSVPRRSRLFSTEAPVWLVGHESHPIPTWVQAFDGEAVGFPGSGGRPDLHRVLGWLGEREINEVHVECGPVLAGAFLAEGLIDELIVYLAPHLMGDEARGLFGLPGLETMADRVNLEWIDSRRVGNDLRLRLRPRFESN